MKNGRILVLGAAGMLGGTLVPILATAGFEVVRHGRNPLPECIDVHADLADLHQVIRLIQLVEPQAVVNLAALSNVDQCETEPHEAYLANELSAYNVARAARDTPELHVIHLSTDQVYDGLGPHSESHVVIRNTYAQTKRAAELVMESCHAAILRTNFFGPSYVGHRRSLSDWIIESLQQGREIPVFTDVFFSPLTMDSLSRTVCELVATRLTGIYNVGSRHGMSKADFALAVARAKGLPTSLLNRVTSETVTSGRARRPKDMRMCVEAIERALGRPMPTLAAEIESIA